MNTGYRIREVCKRKDLGYSQPTKAMHVHLGPHQTDLGQFGSGSEQVQDWDCFLFQALLYGINCGRWEVGQEYDWYLEIQKALYYMVELSDVVTGRRCMVNCWLCEKL